MGRASGAGVDPGRLRALAEQLGQSPTAVARTLRDELVAARAQIDAGLADGAPEAVGGGAHAARNSALMVGARSLLVELRAVEAAAGRGDLAGARAARSRAGDGLARLIEALGELG
jgi:hypothetical protein